MKLLLALCALIPTLAQAEPAFWCKDVSAGPDHGYSVNFGSALRYASVSGQTIAGPQKLAELNCSYTAIPEGHDGSNQPYLSCKEPSKQGGYSVMLSAGGGKITATLYSANKVAAHLLCGRM
ncbi:MAG: hypothetical protein EOP11_07925 [Proteobacteria bacterium]|nr:MAG: hypothetical protein EOP11_07925 [Pseudomonadota bacterium]